MKKIWKLLTVVITLIGIAIFLAFIAVIVEDHTTEGIIREAENQGVPIMISGVAVDTELGAAIVNAEGEYYFFEDGFTWESGQIGTMISGTGNVPSIRKFQEGSIEFKKMQIGLIICQPDLRFSDSM